MPVRIVEEYQPDQPEKRKVRIVEPAAPAEKPKRSLVQEITEGMATFNSRIPLGDELVAGLKTAGNVLTGRAKIPGTLNTTDIVAGRKDAVSDFKANMGQQRALEADLQARRPHTSALVRGTGDAATVLIPGGRFAAELPRASRAVNMARGATTAGLIGAGYAAADRGTGRERLAAASKAATDPVTLLLGMGAGALAPARRNAPRPMNPDVVAARARNIPLTPGQASGSRVLRATENALTSAPILGDNIAAAQHRSIEGFNRAGLNDALHIVSQELPPEVETGHAAIQHTRRALNDVYQELRPVGGVQQDDEMVHDIVGAVNEVLPTLADNNQQRLQTIIDRRVSQPLAAQNGHMDADTFQEIERKLDYEISRHQRAHDPDHQAIGEALDSVRQSLRNAAARQNPEYAQGKAAADRAWATFATMRDAAQSTRALPTGVVTPNEYLGAVKRGEDRPGRLSEGEGYGQELGALGQRLLPNTMPDSGTGRRGLLTGGLGALGVQATHNPVAAAATAATYGAGAGIASLPYTQQGQALFNRVLDRRIAANERNQALAELQRLAQQSPEARALYAQLMQRLPQAAAVGGRAAQPAPSASSQ